MDTISAPRVSTQDKAYDFLKQEIVNGSYKPNQRLKVQQIAQHLAISRTPVKEALGRLEQEGLVKRDLGSGYTVEELSVRDILDLYRVREILELEAAREALPHITDDVIKQMRDALVQADRLLKQKRYNEFLRVNRTFHKTIVANTGNRVLQKVLTSLDARFWSVGTIIVSKHPERADQIRLENHAIFEALLARNLDELQKAVIAHVRGAAAQVKLCLEKTPQHFYIAAA